MGTPEFMAGWSEVEVATWDLGLRSKVGTVLWDGAFKPVGSVLTRGSQRQTPLGAESWLQKCCGCWERTLTDKE